jgi:hypothetical protein
VRKVESRAGDDSMMAFVNEQAMAIVSLPARHRAGRYAALRKVNIEAALAAGHTREQAHELADRTDEFVRAAVRIIESSGGAQPTKPQ